MVGCVIGMGTEAVFSYKAWKKGQISDEEYLKEVLKAGGTMGPLALAEHAGVSMADAGALRSAIGYVDHLLDQIEALA